MWGGPEEGGREGDRETCPGISLSWGGGERRGGENLSEAPQRGQRLPVGGGGRTGSGQLRRTFLEDQHRSKVER